MQVELDALRELFTDARLNSDATRMISLSRVIVQQENAISKQRDHEGKTLPRERVVHMCDEIMAANKLAGQRVLPKELYAKFVDELLVEFDSIWERLNA
jgi:hypothetical protein